MFPFSIAFGAKNDPNSWSTFNVEKVEVNVPLPESDFAVPASLSKNTQAKQETPKQ